MMTKVGVRDLKTHASDIVRRVREENESFEITFRGETVGRIIPTPSKPDHLTGKQSWREWEHYFEKVAEELVDDATLEQTMNEIRRDA